jgi:amidase
MAADSQTHTNSIQPSLSPPSLASITIDDISHGLDKGHFTVVDLVNAHLARIEEVNSVFNAVLEVNPDAIGIAQELDEERKMHGKRRG